MSSPAHAVLNTPELLETILLFAAASLLEPPGTIQFHKGRATTIFLLRLYQVSPTWRSLLLASPPLRRLQFLEPPRLSSPPPQYGTTNDSLSTEPETSDPLSRSYSNLSFRNGFHAYNPFIYTTFQSSPSGLLQRCTWSLNPIPFLGMRWLVTNSPENEILVLSVEKKSFSTWKPTGSWREMLLARKVFRKCFVGRYDFTKAQAWMQGDVEDGGCYVVEEEARLGVTCGRVYDLVSKAVQMWEGEERGFVVCGDEMPVTSGERRGELGKGEMRAWLNEAVNELRRRGGR